MSDLNFDLSQYDEEYASAPVESRDSENVPDGKYQVSVHKLASRESLWSWLALRPATPHAQVAVEDHRARAHWTHGLSQQHDGFCGKHQMAENGIGRPDQDLVACGLALEKLSELPNHLYELLDVALEVTVKTKGEYSNVFLNKRIQTDDASAMPSENIDILPF